MNLLLILLPFFVDDPVEVEADEQIVAEKMTGGTCTVHLHFCTFVLELLHLHCRERWGKGGPIALATRHAINFLQQFIHLHIIHLSLHLHILRGFFTNELNFF